MKHNEIRESADKVFLGLGATPTNEETVRAAVKAECDKHGDSNEVREAVYLTVAARLDRVARIDRVNAAIKSVREDDLPETPDGFSGKGTYEFAYRADRVAEVQEVLSRTGDKRGGPKMDAGRAVLIDSAGYRFRDCVHFIDRGVSLVSVSASRPEHSVLRLAGLQEAV